MNWSLDHLQAHELAVLSDALALVESLLKDYAGAWRIGLERIRDEVKAEQARRANQPGTWIGEIDF